MGKKYPSRRIDGILLLDKPDGITSNAALQLVKRLFRAERAGHTGTLDPMATGLLPICLGEATKFGGMLLESDKGYRAIVRLGERTDTGDAMGQVLERRPVAVDRDQLLEVLSRFRGSIQQVPPMYSAIKQGGRPLYELARRGAVVERSPRTVVIHGLELLSFDELAFEMQVQCSKGTYIRTLGEDIGAQLGCGAHLAGLRRTSSGSFSVEQSVSLEVLQTMREDELDRLLLPVDASLQDWPRTQLSALQVQRFKYGEAVQLLATGEACKSAVYDDKGVFLGLGSLDEQGLLRPRRLLSSEPREKATEETQTS